MQRLVGRVKGRSPSLCPLAFSVALPGVATSLSGCSCSCVRLQSTRALTARPSTSRRRRNKTFVELLEMKEEKMTETKATVSKLKAKHLSKFILSSQTSQDSSFKLESKPENVNLQIDKELLKNIENQILEKYSTFNDSLLKEDDRAIIFTSESVSDVYKLLRDEQRVKFIKESYDKFRKETLRSQKMKDLITAIDEGVNGKSHSDIDSYKKQKNALDELNSSKFNMNQSSNTDTMRIDVLNESTLRSRYIDTMPKLSDLLEEELQDASQNLADGPELISIIDNMLDKKDNLNIERKKKSKKKIKKNSVQALSRNDEDFVKAKEASLIQLLSAYLSICVHNGSLDKACKILKFYRNQGKKPQKVAINDVNIYNIILTAFARKGNYKSLNDILEDMSQDNIQLSIQTYGAIFQCIERSNVKDKHSFLQSHYTEFISKGFTLNDLMNKCTFLYDDRKVLLSAIQKIDSQFVPKYLKPNVNYECVLLNSLNNDGDNVGVYKASAKHSILGQHVLSTHELRENIKNQIKNEKNGTIEIENIQIVGEPSKSVIYYREKLKEMETEWREILKKAFIKNLNTIKAQSSVSHSAFSVYPYLTALEVEEFVDLMMFEIRKIADGSETYSPSIKSLQRELGSKVFSRFYIKTIERNGVLDKLLNLYQQYIDWYINGDKNEKYNMNSRQKWQQLLSENVDGVSLDACETMWPNTVNTSVGKFLYNILINDVKIDVNIFQKNSKKKKYFPILYNVFRGKGKIIRAEIKPHPVLPRLVRESQIPMLTMDTTLTPSLCPPLPWSSAVHGGYLLTKNNLMRVPGNLSEQIEILNKTPYQKLYPALDSLNQLGCVPWIINKPILDVLLSVFRAGGSRSLNVARPSSSVSQPPPLPSSLLKRERAIAIRQRAIAARIRQELHSLWCDSLYKFSLANHFRNKVFWLPHNMDFRGRVYPFPPHLSHLGADTSRALLVFAHGKPLGSRGLTWLKLHCINLTGTMKKNTIQERLTYADSIIDDILDSADNPLKGRRWWSKSDDPWQTLACCMEIANAMRSPNHEEYICHFPIHQDGSCNGLQHYAALGGDSAGAFSVNLDSADRPQDVYSAVVTLVEAARQRDAVQGIKAAQILEGFVKRKVIKQTVMTTVYGVTKFGARLQIARQLKDIDDFPKEYIWMASHYLTQKTFESIREMFTSTKEIQDWLTECAKLISGVCNAKIEWITPLGLPVLQPYYKSAGLKPLAKTDNNIVEVCTIEKFEKPCILKQKNAFPPNFIHSLDSSHMMLTSLYCEASNITFVSVHDCFWTHPLTAEIMNKVCRDQFVALHSQPILQNLSNDLISKYFFHDKDFKNDGSIQEMSKKKLNFLLKKVPQKGNFDLKKVLDSVYFFS